MEGWIVLGSCGLMLISFITMIVSMMDESGTMYFIGLVMLFLGVILFGLSIFVSGKCEKQPWERADEPYVTHTIIALSDGNEIDGKIRGGRYCMSGYINEKFMYVYGYKTAGGGMKIQKVGADVSTVYFDDGVEPCAKWYKWTRKFWWCEREKITCDIYVPTDSLEASITIDLE